MGHLRAGSWFRFVWGGILLVLATLFGSVSAPAQDFVPGRMLVKFREGIPASQAAWTLLTANAREVDQIPQLGIRIVDLPFGTDVKGMVRAMRMTPGVEFAEPDYLFKPTQVTPNDTSYVSSQSSYYNKISAPMAWSVSTGSSNVTIAILDTGVDSSHPDLVLKLVPGRNVQNDTNDTSDLFGHGTTTAGTAGAVTNNSLGVAGVAWGCKIMPIRICSSVSSTASSGNMAKGIAWAADHGCQVANLSYGGAGTSTIEAAAQYLQSKGGILAMSAGNEAMNVTYPTPQYYAIIGASTPSDTLESYSNYGPPITIVAPGTVYTTVPNGGYSFGAGTSYSSPLVAGVLALMKSANPSLSPARLLELVRDNADDIGAPGRDNIFGSGRLNAYAAVQAAANDGGDTTPPTVAILSPGAGATVSGTITVQASASDADSGLQSVTLHLDGVLVGTLTAGPFNWTWNTTASANGSHTLLATARDVAGNTATSTITVTVNNADTTPPTVNFTNPLSGQTVSGNVTVQVSASDSGSGMQNVSLSVDGTSMGTVTSSPYVWSWNTTSLANGNHTLVATARDVSGNTATATITVNVNNADTTPPSVNFTNPLNGQTVSGTVTIAANASDSGSGIQSVYLVIDGVNMGTLTSAPYQWTWNTASLANGSHGLAVTARDVAGNTKTSAINVTVNNQDTTPPTVNFTNPLNGQTVSGTVSVQVSASDSGSGMQSVSLSVDGSSVGTLTSSPYAWSWSTTSLSNGNHTLLATARDVAGNTATKSITVNVNNADTTPPTVNFTNPLSGQSVSGTVNVQVSASDSGSGMQSVSLSIDGSTVGTLTSAPYQWSWNTAGLSNGSHTLLATARDVAGNTATKTIIVNVSNTDTTPPTITITSPSSGYVGRVLNVTVACSDNVGVTRVELYFDGQMVTLSTLAPFNLTWDVRKLRRGNHTLQCKAYDAAGNFGWSQVVNIRR